MRWGGALASGILCGLVDCCARWAGGGEDGEDAAGSGYGARVELGGGRGRDETQSKVVAGREVSLLHVAPGGELCLGANRQAHHLHAREQPAAGSKPDSSPTSCRTTSAGASALEVRLLPQVRENRLRHAWWTQRRALGKPLATARQFLLLSSMCRVWDQCASSP